MTIVIIVFYFILVLWPLADDGHSRLD